MFKTAHARFNACRALSRMGGAARMVCRVASVRDLPTQLAFKVTGSPATLSQAVRG